MTFPEGLGYLMAVQHTHSSHPSSALLQVEEVGLYFRQQLLQSRHRGAFELAYVGFVRLTDMLCRCVSPSGPKTES